MNKIDIMLENRKRQLTNVALSRISTLENLLEYVVKPKILSDKVFCDHIKEIPDPFDACMALSEKARTYVNLSEIYDIGDVRSLNECECQQYAIGYIVVVIFQELNN